VSTVKWLKSLRPWKRKKKKRWPRFDVSEQLALHTFVRDELSTERHRDPRRLLSHGYKVFSQADEDGIIAEIFRRIGPGQKCFAEIGVETGVECNSLWLLYQGWQGLWIEANADSVQTIARTHGQFTTPGTLKVANVFIDAENAERTIREGLGDRSCDLLSIDIDYNDYWVWKSLASLKPRVVIVEYNSRWRPPVAVTVAYDPGRSWAGDSHAGASLEAFVQLSHELGYSLVGCSMSGANAFFVRNDLVGDKFLNPGSVSDHYEPARVFLIELQAGPRPAVGPIVMLPNNET
jgi:hypothetical protein